MNTCICGNAVEQEGALCERCSALQILGLNGDATYKQIESAYRVMVKVWHPDRFQNDPKLKETAEEKLKSINAAHVYLSSGPDAKARRAPKKAAAPTQQATAMRTAGQTKRRTFVDAALASAILLRCLIALAALAVPIILLLGLDSWMTSNPNVGGFYAPYRSRVLFALRSDVDSMKEKLHGVLPRGSTPSPEAPVAASPASVSVPPDTSSQGQEAAISVPVPHIPMPYVTVGLTKEEVETVMGVPTSASADTLRYPGAIFYLHQGKVAGWKVAPHLIPLRVKLWPSSHPDVHLTAFTMGSSRDDVIAVQGTPTLLMENKLAYGASEVFFEGGRVIGWKDSHSSERLRVASR